MKLSILSSYFGPEDKSLPRLAEIGYRRVEVNKAQETSLPAERIRALASDCGIEIHSVMNWDPGLADADPATRARAADALQRNIDWAAALGAKVLESFPGWRGEKEKREAALKVLAEEYHKAAEAAAKVGVTIAVEPVSYGETNLINTLAQGAAIVHTVNHPALRLMGDTHHMYVCERDPARAIRDAAPFLVHMHFSDSNRQPPGLGQMDLLAVVRALAEIGFQGSLSLSEMARVPDAETAASASFRFCTALIETCALRESVLSQPMR